MSKKVTLNDLKSKKGKEKITAITAYDALTGGIFDGEVDMILVGDSLKMSFGGEDSTLSASVDEMIYHTKAVSKAVKKSFLIADLPFGSYSSVKVAMKNALRFYKSCEVDALKIEIGLDKIDVIKAMCDEGVATMAHIGLKPQFMRFDGGFKVKGKGTKERDELLECALRVQEAGAFGILIEGVISSVASEITQSVAVPTIGIGAGAMCDGQILVWSDAFGFFEKFKPKFVRQYLDGAVLLKDAIRQYAKDVKNGEFPSQTEEYN